jgi:hypothetical protein
MQGRPPHDPLTTWLNTRRTEEMLNLPILRLVEQPVLLKAVPGAAAVPTDFTKLFSARDIDFARGALADFERTRRLLGDFGRALDASQQLRALGAAGASPALQKAAVAHEHLASLMKPFELTPVTRDIVGVSDAVASVAGMFSAPALELGRDLAAIASSALTSWHKYIAELPTALDTADLLHVQAAGRGVLGVAASSAILLGEDDAVEVAEEWELAPAEMREQMRDELRQLSPRLVVRLDGAWNAVTHAGPDAVSQAANSAIELIDWTLRAACDDGEVHGWVASQATPDEFLDQHGRPTRQAKIRYLLAERDLEADFVVATARNLNALRMQLQKFKHTQGEHDVAAVARLLPTVESVLYLILSE